MAYQQHPQQYQQHPMQQQQLDVVPGDQYRYALAQFKIAHERVEQQRRQLEEQEQQVAALRGRIALLEGTSEPQRHGKSGNTVDDFSIRNAAAQLDKLINRWAAEVIEKTSVPHSQLCQAAIHDVGNGMELANPNVNPMQLQFYLRHAMSETISEGIINCLIVTNSSEANVQLTRVHEHLFARDPTVASVWRRQTFTAAVEHCTGEMSQTILEEHVPGIMSLLGEEPRTGNVSILETAYSFSRMLHGSPTAGGSADAFYRAFVPELGSTLYARQIELVKRCLKNERGEEDKVGATIFPGLVKVTRGPIGPDGKPGENMQTVVRRAQAICECAMLGPNPGIVFQPAMPVPSAAGSSYMSSPPPHSHHASPPPPSTYSHGNSISPPPMSGYSSSPPPSTYSHGGPPPPVQYWGPPSSGGSPAPLASGAPSHYSMSPPPGGPQQPGQHIYGGPM